MHQSLQVGSRRLGLRLPECGAHIEQSLQDVALVAPEEVDQPGALGRSAERGEGLRQRGLFRGTRHFDVRIASRGELVRAHAVELIGQALEGRLVVGRRAHRPHVRTIGHGICIGDRLEDLTMTQTSDLKRFRDLLDGVHSAMLTSVSADGSLHSRPMALHEPEDDGDLWFIADLRSDKAHQIEGDQHVNLSFAKGDSRWVSVTGTAQLVQDDARLAELWSPFAEAWFPNGRENPGHRVAAGSGAAGGILGDVVAEAGAAGEASGGGGDGADAPGSGGFGHAQAVGLDRGDWGSPHSPHPVVFAGVFRDGSGTRSCARQMDTQVAQGRG